MTRQGRVRPTARGAWRSLKRAVFLAPGLVVEAGPVHHAAAVRPGGGDGAAPAPVAAPAPRGRAGGRGGRRARRRAWQASE